MGFFLETLFGGLMTGMLYSLIALGFVLIFKASGVFNFAQGAIVLFAALAMAPHVGTPRATRKSRERTRARPASSTMAPWAKLNTPDALKINTKPSATRE